MQQNLKNIVLIGLCLIPFIAWYVADGRLLDLSSAVFDSGTSGLFFPFISGKNFLFRFLVEIAFVAWGYLMIRYPEYRPRKTKMLLAYAVFLAAIFIADIFGVDPERSIFSNYERMEGFVTHIHLFAYFVMLTSMFRTTEAWDKFLKVVLGSNVVVLLWGYLQLLGSPQFLIAKIAPDFASKMNAWFPIHMSEGRLDSTLGNSAYFAIYTAIFAFIAILMSLRTTSKNWRYAYYILAVLNLIALYYTATRGTILGIIAGTVVGLGYVAFAGDKKEKRISIIAVSIILALGLAFVGLRNASFVQNSPVLSRFAQISATKDLTTLSRITLWKMSFNAFKDRPILGYGQDNYGYVFARYYDAKMYYQEPWFDRSHNVFFDWLIAGGIVGLLSYLALFGVGVYTLIRKRGDFTHIEQALLLGLLVTYFVHNTLVFDNLVSYILFFTVLAYISVRTEDKTARQHKDIKDYQYILEPLMVLAVLVVFWFSVYKPYEANTTLIKAIDVQRLGQTMTLDKVLLAQTDYFKQALSYNSFGDQEVREQLLSSASRALAYKPDIKTPQDQNTYLQALQALVTEADTEVKSAYPSTKDDARELQVYATLYSSLGQFKEAEKYLVEAHAISPRKQRISFDLMSTYLGEAKTKEAYDLALETYLYATDYPDAATALGVASILAHKEADATAVFVAHNQTFPLTPEIINAYVNVGNLGKAFTLLDQYKKLNPSRSAEVDAYMKTLLDRSRAK